MRLFFGSNIIYSSGALDYLRNIQGSNCFIITDKVLEELGFVKILSEKLNKLGKSYQIFNEVRPDPREDDILKAKELCLSYKPDLIIGFGGGSSMDTAKVVWALYEFPEFNLDDIQPDNEELYGLGKKSKMIAIPTTSGTGAETTFAAVISRFEDGLWKKLDLVNTGMMPTYSIVDPAFPVSMPQNLTIDTGFDALAHSFEALTSRQKNKFSDAICLQALELIFEYLPIVYTDGKNQQARDYMHQAATLAGLAFGNGNVHIGHTMGHSWGALYHTPHGRSVGILLKYVTQFILNDPENKEALNIYAKLSKQLGWVKWDEDDKKAAFMVIEKINELQKKVNFPQSLKETGVKKEDMERDLDTLLDLCYQDASSVLTPRSPSPNEFKEIYKYAYEGKDIDF